MCIGSATGVRSCERIVFAIGDGVSAMRFEDVDRRHGKMVRATACFDPPSFRLALRSCAGAGAHSFPAALGGGGAPARFQRSGTIAGYCR